MLATLTQVVQQFRQEWTTQLAPAALLTACHDVGYAWRERCLDPVTTTQVFFVQVVNGNTACTHLRPLTKLDVTASAYGQARMKLPLAMFERLLAAVYDHVQHQPLEEGRWLGHRTFWTDGSSFSMADTPESCTTRRAGGLMKAPRGGQYGDERASRPFFTTQQRV